MALIEWNVFILPKFPWTWTWNWLFLPPDVCLYTLAAYRCLTIWIIQYWACGPTDKRSVYDNNTLTMEVLIYVCCVPPEAEPSSFKKMKKNNGPKCFVTKKKILSEEIKILGPKWKSRNWRFSCPNSSECHSDLLGSDLSWCNIRSCYDGSHFVMEMTNYQCDKWQFNAWQYWY